MTEKDKMELEPEETVFWFAFVCRGTLRAYEKIKQAILKAEGCELRYQTKSPVRIWIMKEKEGATDFDGRTR
ncbi:hypothetical protein H5T51_03190 [Candidatus Bathyarchaeota archaeon]|nr:hypothetical protein [Candidatus Bathyarchaeota archaeon]